MTHRTMNERSTSELRPAPWHRQYCTGPYSDRKLPATISSKGYFICTTSQTGYHIPWPLLHQLYSIGGGGGDLRNISMGPPRGIDPTTYSTMSRCSTMEIYLASMPVGSLNTLSPIKRVTLNLSHNTLL